MKRIAGERETVVSIPLIVDVVEVQVPPVCVEDDVRDVLVTVDLHLRTAPLHSAPSVSLPLEFSPGCIVFGSSRPAE